MRITGGTHRSRTFAVPENLGIRPTTDFAKEAIFNILHHRMDLEGLEVLDLFGGSGAISYEFASRGSSSVVTVEKNPKACALIKKNCETLKFNTIHVIRADAFSFLKTCSGSFHIIFADPPYRLPNPERIPVMIQEKGLLRENGILIVEHPAEVNFSQIPGYQETRTYGTVNFSIFGKV